MVSGTVIDRVTRQPVKSFRVFQGDDESSGRYAEEGRYQVRLYNQSHPNVVRIEAEGYQPASSREITEQKTARVDFELTKGQDAEGVVLTPAGLPAAGAKLAMTSGPFYGYSTSSISNGDLTGGAHGIEMRETDATGHFRFPPQDRDFFLLVIHPSGFVCFKPVPRSNYQRITLRPYARVEGTYRVAGKPVAGMRMILNASAHVEGPVERGPQIENRSRTTTGPDGRFAFEHVPAGSGSISGELKYTPHVGHAGAASACTVPLLEFSAGKVVKVDIGQHGRAVTGRLKPPRGFAKPVQWQIATLDVEPAHYDRTAEYLSFKASVDHEGRFRVDDVPPGRYKLTCWSVQFGNDPPCTTSIVVPKQDIRPLGQLLDLGELELSKN
ncbi:MAG TPA: hypothetical protein VG055_32125 [Planctomycetaceae bacterium]|jgi:hypothetical protein|nr:hypothetical protein [Planctomycetaceae bacterium]